MSKSAVSWVRSKCVGRGSYGAVSIGVDRFDGRVFAVKSVEQRFDSSQRILCLENEIRILRSLNSPYVVAFLGDDVTHESPSTSFRNMHMEFLPGGTVADSIDGDEKLVRARTWCVVSALSYIHSRGVVHCDVKGRNILVGRDRGFVKLADFGSALEISGDGVAGAVVPRGSPLWMAPEVVRGEAQGPESDVWSVGCTVIEMITGKPAWDDFGADTLSRICYSEEVPEFPAQLSEIGRDFLEKCLRRDPAQRWSSDELLQHPFLAAAKPNMAVEESSPRCVLDWVNADFEDDEDDDYSAIPDSDDEISGRGRVRKLSGSGGANWESDGWLAVRSLERDAEASGSCGGDDEEGTSSEYSEFAEDNNGRISAEYSNHGGIEFQERTNSYSNWKFECGSGGGAEWSRRQGCGKREITVMTLCILCNYSIQLILYYWRILMKQWSLFMNYILYFF